MAVAEKLATATDLARNSAQILDDAAKGPVSIPRGKKKPDITLVRRDRWQQAECAEQWMSAFTAIVRYSLARIGDDEEVGYPQEFEWLSALEGDDMFEFLKEFSQAMKNAVGGVRSWNDVEDVLHEWHRSALVMLDAELSGRLKQAKADLQQ